MGVIAFATPKPYVPPPASAKAYLAGGWTQAGHYQNTTHEYDPSGDVWTEKATFETGRNYLAGTDILGKGYVSQGMKVGNSWDRETNEYSPDTWVTKTPALITAYSIQLTASTILNKGYFYGGQNVNYCNEYDPDTWTAKTNMTANRGEAGSCTILDKGYVFCGFSGTDWTTPTVTVYEYSPDTWTARTSAPTPARTSTRAATINDKGYIFGGYTVTQAKIADTDEYTPTSTWVSKTNMPFTTSAGSVVAINNKAYYMSGFTDAALWSLETYEYDPDTFTAKQAMTVGHDYGTAFAI